MKFAICTGSRADRDMLSAQLSRRLRELCADIGIDSFDDAGALLEKAAAAEYAVVLLDADYSADGGIGIATALHRADCDCKLIIFASDTAHALRSYSVHPVGYCIKPVEYAALSRTLDWCRNVWSGGLRSVEVTVSRTPVRIPLTEILSAEISGRYLSIRTSSAPVQVSMSMSEFERRVGGSPFLRCHKSFLVNMFRISGADPLGFITEDGLHVPVSDERRRPVMEEYARFLTENLMA